MNKNCLNQKHGWYIAGTSNFGCGRSGATIDPLINGANNSSNSSDESRGPIAGLNGDQCPSGQLLRRRGPPMPFQSALARRGGLLGSSVHLPAVDRNFQRQNEPPDVQKAEHFRSDSAPLFDFRFLATLKDGLQV